MPGTPRIPVDLSVAWYNITSLPPLIAQAEFLPADVQRVVALTTALGQASFAFAPSVFGLLRSTDPLGFDLHPGGAPLLFATAIMIQLCSSGAAILGRSGATQMSIVSAQR